MHRSRALLAALALGLATGAGEASAQRASATPATPGTVTLRYYQCNESQLGAAADLLGGGRRRIAEELVDEGLLLDYEILTRVWGDEWNLIELYVATDAEAFRYAYEELELRYRVTDATRAQTQRFETMCPRRRDGRYDVVQPS